MRHAIADNLWIGDHAEKPYAEELDVVITLGAKPGTLEDGVRHFIYPDALRPEGIEDFITAIETLDSQWGDHRRRTLVRADGQSAYVWPSFLIASLLHDYGASAEEALATACPTAAFMSDDDGAGPLKARLES